MEVTALVTPERTVYRVADKEALASYAVARTGAGQGDCPPRQLAASLWLHWSGDE